MQISFSFGVQSFIKVKQLRIVSFALSYQQFSINTAFSYCDYVSHQKKINR